MRSIRVSDGGFFVGSVLVAVSTILLMACGSPIENSQNVAVAPDPATEAPLPSWNEGPGKSALVDFVERVTDPTGPDFVPESQRVAVFDNDGTLWSEQPLYFQGLFALDRIRAMAPDHPEWQNEHPYKAVLSGDPAQLATLSEEDLFRILEVTHSGMTVQEFAEVARDWLENARHPRFDVPHTQMVYQPMLELLEYLRAHGIQTFIVSGGGIGLMRQFAETVYGIPPDQVVGSSIEEVFEMRDGEPVIVRQPKLHFLNDKAGKPVGINRFIGIRPLMAFGNSDGDLQMLQYTAAGDGPRFMALVRHDDADREWAYDRDSHVGRLDQALDEAEAKGWTVVSMKDDWKRVYPFSE